MTNRGYFQRLIDRLEPPAQQAAPPLTPPATPGKAGDPAPSLYDPFAEAAVEWPALTPTLEAQLPVAEAPMTISGPAETTQPAPIRLRDRVIHEYSEPGPAALPLEPPPAAAQPPTPLVPEAEQGGPLPTPLPLALAQEPPAPPLVYELPPPAQAVEMPVAGPEGLPPALPPPLEREPIERVLHERIELAAAAPPPPLEPPSELAAALAPAAAAPAVAPQITIGDIVVEIVARPEIAARSSAPPPARAARPASPTAPRSGVRSKRGYGMGQM